MFWNRRYNKMKAEIAELETNQFLIEEKFKALQGYLNIEIGLNIQKKGLFIIEKMPEESK